MKNKTLVLQVALAWAALVFFVWAMCGASGAAVYAGVQAAPPVFEPKQEAPPEEPAPRETETKEKEGPSPVVVKNIMVAPQMVDSNGSPPFLVRCMVFTASQRSYIQKVWLDMRHTALFSVVELAPEPGNILLPTGEGYYQARIKLPANMAPGRYRLPLFATDSTQAMGRAMGEMVVAYKPPARLFPVGSARFNQGLEQAAGSVFTPGNRVTALHRGPMALEMRLRLIQDAQERICLQSYTFAEEAAGGRLMEALAARADQGLEVDLILNGATQIPTSPVGTLKLLATDLVSELAVKARDKVEKTLEDHASWTKRFIPKSKESNVVNLAVFSSLALSNSLPAVAQNQKLTDHWLAQLIEARFPSVDPSSQWWTDGVEGPGGLPSLPLLDYAVHEKMLITDGRKAIIGGRNLENRYFDQWNDLDLYLEGPVVGQAQRGFDRTLGQVQQGAVPMAPEPAAAPGPGKARAMYVQSLPWERRFSTLQAVVYALQSARQSVYITSQYIVLPESLLADAVMGAARRGVDVRILTNSRETGQEVGMAAGFYLTLGHLEKLLDAGVRVWEVRGNGDPDSPQPYLHAKEFVFDTKLAAVGSFNLSLRSCYIESENLVFVDEAGFAAGRQEAFLEMLDQKAEEITPARLENLRKEYKTRMEIARPLDLLF